MNIEHVESHQPEEKEKNNSDETTKTCAVKGDTTVLRDICH